MRTGQSKSKANNIMDACILKFMSQGMGMLWFLSNHIFSSFSERDGDKDEEALTYLGEAGIHDTKCQRTLSGLY